MEFSIKKCAVLVIEKGKIVKSVGTDLVKLLSHHRKVKIISFLGFYRQIAF